MKTIELMLMCIISRRARATLQQSLTDSGHSYDVIKVFYLFSDIVEPFNIGSERLMDSLSDGQKRITCDPGTTDADIPL